VHTDAHGRAERIELPEAKARELVGDDVHCIAHFDAAGEVHSLAIPRSAAPKAPPLWFVEVPEPTGTPPALSLVAFTGHGVEAGRLLTSARIAELGVTSADQVAAARWYPATGEGDQIYVQPDWRRRGIASVLATAASTLSVARGNPPLWTDGQRTAMGDRWLKASPWSHRAAELTHLAPPMTPIEKR
jgi:GNAT superfamily N-acetyltransferase